MKIETRDFGTVEIQPEDIIQFVSPIYGFEELTQYIFLYEENNSHIVWLQSVEDPAVCFIMADPAVVQANYRPELPPRARQMLGEGEYLYWLILVVAPDFRDSTVNLKSPVVLNISNNRAVQWILEEDLPIRYPLTPRGKERV